MNECIFCKIVNLKIPSYKLYEDEFVLAFLDVFPASYGHSLVIPKKHYETIFDIPKEELLRVMCVVQKLAFSIRTNLKPDGLNIVQSNYKSAGQVIGHVHFHLIPREEDDKQPLSWNHIKCSEDEFKNIVERIKIS